MLAVFVTVWIGRDPGKPAIDLITELGASQQTEVPQANPSPATGGENNREAAEQSFTIPVDEIANLVEQAEMQRESQRQFVITVIDRVLVNVLLPVLTALLGYIFGTSQNSAGTEEEK